MEKRIAVKINSKSLNYSLISRYLNRSGRSLFFLIVIQCLTFSQSKAQLLDKIIAKVDNEIILKSELELNYIQYLASGQDDPKGELKCELLETLIVNKMLVAKATIDSVVVERVMVEDQLQRRMDYFISQIGSVEKLEEYYGKTINELKDDLRKQVREQMIVQKMQDVISQKVKVTPSDVKKYYNSIPKDSLPYFSTEVEVGQIVKKPLIGREEKLAAKAELESIKQRILKGEDFCSLAKIYSEDPGSAVACGELGFFQKGTLVPEYEAVAYRLKPGELSVVTESEYGYHLIQLIERRANEVNTRHILIKPKSSDSDIANSEKYLDSLKRRILSDSISFEKAAKEYSDDKITQDNGGLMMDSKTGFSQIPMENLDPSVFFIIDTMKLGTITDPIPYRMSDGTVAMRIIYFKSRTPPHLANLRDDYQKIYKAATAEKKSKMLSEWFDKTKNEVYIDIDDEYTTCQLQIMQQ